MVTFLHNAYETFSFMYRVFIKNWTWRSTIKLSAVLRPIVFRREVTFVDHCDLVGALALPVARLLVHVLALCVVDDGQGNLLQHTRQWTV